MIFVTGATGFLGARVVQRLTSSGKRVRALARKPVHIEGADVFVGDITDRESVRRAADGASAIIHCAAHYEFGADAKMAHRTNVDGTRNILELGLPTVHISSTAALGPTQNIEVESHWNPQKPASIYAETKRLAHLVAREMRARIVAPATIYGAGDRSPVGLLHRLVARGLLPIGFRKRVQMSLVFVDDCADAIVRVLEHGTECGEYIAAADVVTFEEWLTAIAHAAHRSPPRAYVSDRSLAALTKIFPRASFLGETLAMSDRTNWAFSGAKLRSELGWSPRSLAQGLEQTIDRKRSGSWSFGFTR